MYCKALNCSLELDGSSSNWCFKHAKKMIKYYKTYKKLEVEINIDSIEQNITEYTIEELIDLNLKLLKVHHYRTTLQEQGYTDYQDDGHAYRVNRILQLITTIWTEIQNKHLFIDDSEQQESEKQKAPRATSTRKLKKKIEKFNLGDLVEEHRAPVKPIIIAFAKKYKQYLFNVVREYFINKFGTHGLDVFMPALTQAVMIYTICADWSISGGINMTKPGDCAFSEDYHTTLTRVNEILNSNKLDGIYTFSYALLLLIDSFRIPVDSIIYDPKEVDRLRTEYLSRFMKKYEHKFEDVDFDRVNNKLKRNINTTLELPKIDIAFCMKIALSTEKIPITMHCVSKNKYIFYAGTAIKSVVLDFENKFSRSNFHHVFIPNNDFLADSINQNNKGFNEESKYLLEGHLLLLWIQFTPIHLHWYEV